MGKNTCFRLISDGDTCTVEEQECNGLPYSVCRMGQCLCRDGFYEVGKVCKAELGEFVDKEEDCGGGNFVNGRCVCDNHWFYNYHMRSCLKGRTSSVAILKYID